MGPVQTYKDLIVWQKSMAISSDIETLAARLPGQYKFGLASQLRRASSSIPFNIAEGQQRTTRAYIHHLTIALGSEAELQTQLKLLQRIQIAPREEIDALLDRTREVGRMLRGLIRSLREHLLRNSEL